jgi:polyhydroxyalkanoate synthesis repressor PhaR
LQRNKKSWSIFMLNKPGDTPEKSEKREAVVIKKYANRRLYNTETSTYVTLEDLATMVRGDRDFVVYDAKTGDELTHSVLTQIIVEQESRAAGGSQMLPIPFLRQLIRFYDDSIGRMVPSYLQMSLETLVKEQERFRSQFANAWAPVSFEAYQEQARKNLAILDQAMTMWSPFAAGQRGARQARRSWRDADSRCRELTSGGFCDRWGDARRTRAAQGRNGADAGQDREAVKGPELTAPRRTRGRPEQPQAGSRSSSSLPQ